MTSLEDNKRGIRGNAGRSDRGVILIFVVVLLVLLAIMGTAYLAASRADRLAVTGRGAGGVSSSDLLPDRTNLEATFNTVQRNVMYRLVKDLYDVNEGAVALSGNFPADRFRREGEGSQYRGLDAPGGSDPHLASTLPTWSGTAPLWQNISRPLPNITGSGPFVSSFGFADPRAFLLGGFQYAGDVSPEVWAQPVLVPDPAYGTYNPATARSRVYPAFRIGGNVRIAADTDGDGAADAGLSPYKINGGADGTYSSYEDPRNPGVVYFYGYRVVDNSSLVNVNTAFAVTGDFDPATVSGNDLINGNPNLPNLGFSRSNVGLVELLRYLGSLTQADVALPNAYLHDVRQLLNLKLTNRTGNSSAIVPNAFEDALLDNGNTYSLNGITNVTHRSLGEAFEQGINRRLGNGGASAGAFRFGSFGSDDARGLRYRPGLLNPQLGQTQMEQTLVNSTYWQAINYARKRGDQFGTIPAVIGWTLPGTNSSPAVPMGAWWEWIYNFSHPNSGGAGIDSSATATDFAGANGYTFNNQAFRRSIRPLLTAVSGESATAPLRGRVTGTVTNPTGFGVPVGMEPLTASPERFTRASAATSRFPVLWRAYWSLMVDPTSPAGVGNLLNSRTYGSGNTIPPMFHAASRTVATSNAFYNGTLISLANSARMALIRSAIAAANTIDLRDADDDLTVVSINLSQTGAGPWAYVAGTERQPFITGVAVRTSTVAANRYVAIELYNPYNIDIDLSRFGLALSGARSGTGDIPNGSVIALSPVGTLAAGAFVTIVSSNTTPGGVSINGAVRVEAGLVNAINREVFLVRKQGANQTVTAADNLTNAVPANRLYAVDLADLRVLTNTGGDQVFNHTRPAGPGSEWRFVYAGNWESGSGIQTGGAILGQARTRAGSTIPNAPPIQLQNFKPDIPADQFPYGSPFARDGDVLAVPFIGSYQIRNNNNLTGTNTVHEINPVTADAVMSDPGATPTTRVGRFIPQSDEYGWTRDLFAYISARQAPAEALLPDVPMEYVDVLAPATAGNRRTTGFTIDGSAVTLPLGSVNLLDQNAGNTLVQGKINVNTAPELIRRLLPLTVDGNGFVQPGPNATAANLLSPGNYLSLLEVNDLGTGIGSTFNAGDISTNASVVLPAGTDDYEVAFQNHIRISNLATTRSDSYTVYITVQAWRTNGGGVNPVSNPARLLAERRAAYLVDRGVITPVRGSVDHLLQNGVTVIEQE
jgi:hypothetical protein